MENTIENKEKFFAQHWGQKVYKHIHNTGILDKIVKGFFLDRSKEFEGDYLEVKSLSSITDEDAIEVARITKIDFMNETEEEWRFGKELIRDCFIYYDNWLHGQHNIINNDISLFDLLEISDYLRSKGYALPFNGLSVEKQIEYGWIKLNP